MRNIIFAFLFFGSLTCFAQDTIQPSVAILAGANTGVGFTLNQPQLSSNYGGLVHEQNVDVPYALYVSVLFKERFGFRLSAGRAGWLRKTEDFVSYTELNYPGYHYLFVYSDLKSGYRYTYVTPQFSYRVATEQFNFTSSLGFGIGKLELPTGTAILQKNGSNDFTVLKYEAGNTGWSHALLNLEFAYMRQLSQHIFLNAGLFAEAMMINTSIEFHLSQADYGQMYQYINAGHWSGQLYRVNTGIFLNFQWNKRESPRAYYE